MFKPLEFLRRFRGASNEKTKNQTPPLPIGAGVVILPSGESNQTIPKPAGGLYKTYRDMRTDPTIALARAVARAPVKAAEWSADSDDENLKQAVTDEFTPLWAPLMQDILFALDYGFQGFEKVWELRSDRMLHYKKLKPLLPEKTTIMVDEQDGSFAGLKQGEVELAPPYSYLYTYDKEAGNLYGRSRHENIRTTAWSTWKDTTARNAKYSKKVAGAIPLIEYPEGTGLDANGNEVTNFELAQAILRNLSAIDGVAMPNTLTKHLEDLARMGGAGKDLVKAWSISFLETNGNHGKDFIDNLNYQDKLKVRGWLLPERAILEGEHGTKAESESHSDWAFLVGQELTSDIFMSINMHLVDPFVAVNFGPERVGDVRLSFAGINPAVIAFLRQLLLKTAGAPANIDLLMEIVDLEQVVEQVGLPQNKSGESIVVVRDKPLSPGDGEEEIA